MVLSVSKWLGSLKLPAVRARSCHATIPASVFAQGMAMCSAERQHSRRNCAPSQGFFFHFSISPSAKSHGNTIYFHVLSLGFLSKSKVVRIEEATTERYSPVRDPHHAMGRKYRHHCNQQSQRRNVVIRCNQHNLLLTEIPLSRSTPGQQFLGTKWQSNTINISGISEFLAVGLCVN